MVDINGDKRERIILRRLLTNKETRRSQVLCKKEASGGTESDETSFTGEGLSDLYRGTSRAYIKYNKKSTKV